MTLPWAVGIYSKHMDLSVVVVPVLLATVALRVALVCSVVWLLVPRRARCPHCNDEAIPLVGNRVLGILRLERRWCMACGWSGISKRVRTSPRPKRSLPERSDVGEVTGDSRWRTRWDDDTQWGVGDDAWR